MADDYNCEIDLNDDDDGFSHQPENRSQPNDVQSGGGHGNQGYSGQNQNNQGNSSSNYDGGNQGQGYNNSNQNYNGNGFQNNNNSNNFQSNNGQYFNQSGGTGGNFNNNNKQFFHGQHQNNSNNFALSFSPTTAIVIQTLEWWVNEEDVRGYAVHVNKEKDIQFVVFDEHKVNGKSKGIVYLEFSSPEAADIVKNHVQATVKGENSSPVNISFVTPTRNPFRPQSKNFVPGMMGGRGRGGMNMRGRGGFGRGGPMGFNHMGGSMGYGGGFGMRGGMSGHGGRGGRGGMDDGHFHHGPGGHGGFPGGGFPGNFGFPGFYGQNQHQSGPGNGGNWHGGPQGDSNPHGHKRVRQD